SCNGFRRECVLELRVINLFVENFWKGDPLMATTWTREERSAIMRFSFDDGSFYEQRVVEQLLDPGNDASAKFYLYYFVKDQTYENKDKPTILFAAGGPGQMIMPDYENFSDIYGYRNAYFYM